MSKILLKLGIVILIAVLYFSIYVPADILTEEKRVLEESKSKLTTIYEAEKYYKRKNNVYTDNFDTLLTFIKSDTVFQDKVRLTTLTAQLTDALKKYVNKNDVTYAASTYKVSESSGIAYKILDEIKDDFKSNPDVANKAEEIMAVVNGILTGDDLLNFNNIRNNIDSILSSRIEIERYTLQEAVQNVLTYNDYVLESLETAELSVLKNSWLGVKNDLTVLETLINKTGKVQNKTLRYNNQLGIILKNIDRISSAKSSAKAEFEAGKNSFEAIRDVFSNSENFELSQRNARTILNDDERAIAAIDENTIFAPPIKGNRYSIELDLGGKIFKASCPNKIGSVKWYGVFNQHYKNYGFVTQTRRSWDK